MPEFEVVTELARLLDIQPAWCALAEKISPVTPFQTPDWQLTWWRHFGSGQLRVFCSWNQDALVAIVPCFLHQWEGRHQLTLIGSGISDYLEPLIDPAHENQVLQALQAYLKASKEWDICNWQDLSSGTHLGNLSGSVLEADTPCSEVQLTGTFGAFWSSRSKDLRRNLRRYTDRARSLGELSFFVSEYATEELLSVLVHLHAARWEKRGEPGMIVANASGDFLRSVASVLSNSGHLRFFAVRFQEKIAALMMAFVFRRTVYSYLSAFDPQYEILGFGRTLLYESFRYAYDHGCRAWNFCRGDEPYKLSWGAEPIEKRRLILTRDSNSNIL